MKCYPPMSWSSSFWYLWSLKHSLSHSWTFIAKLRRTKWLKTGVIFKDGGKKQTQIVLDTLFVNWGYRDLSSGVQDEVEKEERKLKQEWYGFLKGICTSSTQKIILLKTVLENLEFGVITAGTKNLRETFRYIRLGC